MNINNLNQLRKISQDLNICGDIGLCEKIKIIIANETGGDNINPDLTYSSVMRDLRHNQKDKVNKFMVAFKNAFDEAVLEELEDPDRIALLAAIKEISYES